VDRRQFITAGVTAAAVLATAEAAFSPSPDSSAYAWPHGCIERLPHSATRRMAWTVDDGASVRALRAYVKLLEQHEELRMTMFVWAGAGSWKKLAKPLTELAQSGRVQMANHTMNHVSLTSATDRKVKQELVLAGRFIEDTFGVDPGPYWRPPYGNIDSRVIKIATDAGLDKPVLWYGSTASNVGVHASSVWANCQKWMTNGRIVIDHANSMSTVSNFGRIRGLLASRNLETVTISDAFGTIN
jgi:peptidoglycan/xylan/chitin deacetylase (PgdA/CDA1 family)